MTRPARLLIGGRGDAHVLAVLEHLPAAGTALIDVASMSTHLVRVQPHRTDLRDLEGGVVSIGRDLPARGWLRRLGPAGWDDGAVLGGHAAARLSARLNLLAGVIRDDAITWLTSVDAQFRAENKIVQYRTAHALGLRVPATRVAIDANDVRTELGSDIVLKPLGPGGFRDDSGGWQIVYARALDVTALEGTDLTAAPFLAQQRVDARVHLRVVTVGNQAWVTALDAHDVPVDWREDAFAHDSFISTSEHSAVAVDALRLARAHHCGYTSQDWIIDKSGHAWFIDLNPAGQWLFLPKEVSTAVSYTVAQTLTDPIGDEA